MAKKDKKRFFGFKGVLWVATVVLTIVLGLVIYRMNPSEEAIKYISTTDSAGIFSYEYPEVWTHKPHDWDACCNWDLNDDEPDWSKVSKPITLHPLDDEEAIVTITQEEYGSFWESYEALREYVDEDYFAEILFDSIRDDGHRALFARVDYLGPPDAKVESFTDHRYYFDNGDSVVRVEFREKYHHDWPDDEMGPDIDRSRYLADFEHIAQSIKFNQSDSL